MSKLLTVKEVAGILSVSATTVYEMCREGKLVHNRIGVGRGAIRIKPSELERLLSQSEVVPQSVPVAERDWVFGTS